MSQKRREEKATAGTEVAVDNVSARRDGQPAVTAAVPDPEVAAKPTQRQFTAEYKLRILREAESQRELGAIGALLRREGLYSTHLTTWRRERERGALESLRARRRGRKADPAAEFAPADRHAGGREAAPARAPTAGGGDHRGPKELSEILGLAGSPPARESA